MNTEIAEYFVITFGIVLISGFPIWLYIKYNNDEKKRHQHRNEALHKRT